MPDSSIDGIMEAFRQRRRALSRWENEGGALPSETPADVTPHPLTIRAAHQMTGKVDRAVHFRTVHSAGPAGDSP